VLRTAPGNSMPPHMCDRPLKRAAWSRTMLVAVLWSACYPNLLALEGAARSTLRLRRANRPEPRTTAPPAIMTLMLALRGGDGDDSALLMAQRELLRAAGQAPEGSSEDFMKAKDESSSVSEEVPSIDEILEKCGITVEMPEDIAERWAPSIEEAGNRGAVSHAKAQARPTLRPHLHPPRPPGPTCGPSRCDCQDRRPAHAAPLTALRAAAN
jgi:hypothetical protein